jgi:hypothetical protein
MLLASERHIPKVSACVEFARQMARSLRSLSVLKDRHRTDTRTCYVLTDKQR